MRVYEWEAARPILTPTQLRLLVAFHSGAGTVPQAAEMINRHEETVRDYGTNRLKELRLVRYNPNVKRWIPTMPWPETVEHIQNLVRWHYRTLIESLNDFHELPRLKKEEEDDEDGG